MAASFASRAFAGALHPRHAARRARPRRIRRRAGRPAAKPLEGGRGSAIPVIDRRSCMVVLLTSAKLGGGPPPFEQRLIDEALDALAVLPQSQGEQVLLHTQLGSYV